MPEPFYRKKTIDCDPTSVKDFLLYSFVTKLFHVPDDKLRGTGIVSITLTPGDKRGKRRKTARAVKKSARSRTK